MSSAAIEQDPSQTYQTRVKFQVMFEIWVNQVKTPSLTLYLNTCMTLEAHSAHTKSEVRVTKSQPLSLNSAVHVSILDSTDKHAF